MEIELCETGPGAAEALTAVDEGVVGVDVERANGQRYYRIAALVQVGVPDRCVMLDGLALEDLTPLDEFLNGRLAVFHAIENDVDSLEDEGVRLERVADTAIAASLLALPPGLDSLLHDVLDVELDGNKKRMQRADWTQRPLPEEMITYAAGDVIHLPVLWGELERRLSEAGRLDWYAQELEHTMRLARESKRAWSKTKGLGRLDERGRAVLRAAWEAREAVAQRENLAPQVVARDDVLVAAAEQPPESAKALEELGLRPDQRTHAGDLLTGIARGRDAPPEPRPNDHRPSTPQDRDAHDRMRRARAAVAEEVDIDPGVLCPARILWDAVLEDPVSPEELCDAAGLRPWQRGLLADVLWDAYTDHD